MLTDQIVKGLLENDYHVIKFIYKSYFKAVKNFVTNHGGSNRDASDIFQESILVVFEKLRQDPAYIQKNFPSYLFGVSKYLWKQQRRDLEKAVHTINLNEEVQPGLEFAQIPRDIEIETLAMKEKRDRVFQEAYISLKPDCRKIIDLVINGCTVEEIADFMDYTTVSNAYRKRQYCKEKLMAYIHHNN